VLDVPDAPGLDVPGLDFCQIGRGYGVRAVQAGDARTLRHELARALEGDEPVLIEVPTLTIEP